MSRYAGCWVALKLVTDVVESSANVMVSPGTPQVVLPNIQTPEEGLHIRAADPPLQQEARLYNHKLPAALAYARANGLNRVVLGSKAPRLGIITAGKAYLDTYQALMALGLARPDAGVKLLKLGLVWPLDPDTIAEFAADLDTILVVEEKRPVIEEQIKSILFDVAAGRRIRVIGKRSGQNVWTHDTSGIVLPAVGELDSHQVKDAIAKALGIPPEQTVDHESASNSTANIAPLAPGPMRLPSFCSGCPHNTSTKVPEGSRALAGIGCHGIASMQQPGITGTISHMGGEGVMWVGQAPFTNEKHIFANLGDGTYFHSGILAIRQAVAAKVPITYKLLVNGFVSMTGGQPIEGDMSVPQIVAELQAEGVKRIEVVADDPGRYDDVSLPDGVKVAHRRELDSLQRDLRSYPGVSVLIYDQMCATERRRLRKRGEYPDLDKRILINQEVCEGCGDCTAKSNCMSVEPVETELGRKRRINQSSCNKDFSCIEGFCPSFVTVHGGRLRGGSASQSDQHVLPELPEPQLPNCDTQAYGVLIAGIGGTGVVTIGAVLAMAAHIDGKSVTTLDVTGLAQKYGAVMSHLRIGANDTLAHPARLGTNEADVLIGCDLVVSAGDEALSRLAANRTWAVVNSRVAPTSDFLRNPDWNLNSNVLLDRIRAALKEDSRLNSIAATEIAQEILGDAIASNMMMLGYAWQRGWIPVSRAAIERAIELNGVAVPLNQQGFQWGRHLAHDAKTVQKALKPAAIVQWTPKRLHKLDDIVADRSERLRLYQNRKYSQRYRDFVERVKAAEQPFGSDALAKAVARNYYKLLAYKDEFEVARLYASPEFRQQLNATFEGDYKLRFHLGAWPFAKRDPATGLPRKRELGPWMMPAMRTLAALRGVRGTWLDPFRTSDERKLAMQLIADYEDDMQTVITELDADRLQLACEIANWPEYIRGYGYVREASAEDLVAKRSAWRERWSGRSLVQHETLVA